MRIGAGAATVVVEVPGVNRSGAPLLVLIAALALGACSSEGGDEATSGPCDLLRSEDAAELLGGPVEQIGYAEYLAASTTIPADDQAKVAAVAERICLYRSETDGSLASIQVDRGLFKNEDEFRNAFGAEVEQLGEPGLAAIYETVAGDRDATHLGILVNANGDSIDLSVSGAQVARSKMSEIGETIVDRF